MKDVKIKVANALLVGGMVLSTVSPQLTTTIRGSGSK